MADASVLVLVGDVLAGEDVALVSEDGIAVDAVVSVAGDAGVPLVDPEAPQALAPRKTVAARADSATGRRPPRPGFGTVDDGQADGIRPPRLGRRYAAPPTLAPVTAPCQAWSPASAW
ncbi:MAG TPA: hypothetical protein PKH97_13340 [Tetrasphaera sp.]|uniref:hypothetical protein n=1 Tax=Nostocoides sp. TaxID=1917966 RepID=UPI002B7CDEDF|nr:hypothetical protein [Tetrasphaera sp.]HNQ08155.1 hypothetical protein [Tetrasphaera sp.]